jgi:hypothetical protein
VKKTYKCDGCESVLIVTRKPEATGCPVCVFGTFKEIPLAPNPIEPHRYRCSRYPLSCDFNADFDGKPANMVCPDCGRGELIPCGHYSWDDETGKLKMHPDNPASAFMRVTESEWKAI